MEEGIVPGGGIAFSNVIGKFDGTKEGDTVKGAAVIILRRALEAPARSIIENSGESAQSVMSEIMREKSKGDSARWIGFNADTTKIGNLKEWGIIDPLKVAKTAFTNALSVAATYLTIGVAVSEIPEEKDKKGGMPGGMPGGMGDY